MKIYMSPLINVIKITKVVGLEGEAWKGIMNELRLRKMLQSFLLEDIGERDVTSQSIFPPDKNGRGVFIAKDDGIIAGLHIIKEAYHLLHTDIVVNFHYTDGDKVSYGDVIAEVTGPIVHLLTGERII